MRLVAESVAVESGFVLEFACYGGPCLSEVGGLQGVAYDAVTSHVFASSVVVHVQKYLHVAFVGLTQEVAYVLKFVGAERAFDFALQAFPLEGQTDKFHIF